MRRAISLLLVALLAPALVACGGGSVPPGSGEELSIRTAVAFISSREGSPGVFVKGRDIAITYAQRPAGFEEVVREAALAANKAVGKQVKVYVIDSATVATAIPGKNDFYCSMSANDGRIAGDTC